MTDPSQEGFLHNGRIIYAAQYYLAGGWTQIVWFDRSGHDLHGQARLDDPARRAVTAKPGDWLWYGPDRRLIERVEVWLENRA